MQTNAPTNYSDFDNSTVGGSLTSRRSIASLRTVPTCPPSLGSMNIDPTIRGLLDHSDDWATFQPSGEHSQRRIARKSSLNLDLFVGYPSVWDTRFLHFASEDLRRIVDLEVRVAQVKQEVLSRVKDLHEAALDDDMTISKASEADLRHYVIRQLRPTQRPSISLLANGNLRAHWKDANGRQIGLQFQGGGWVQYVLFWQAQPSSSMSTSVGRTEVSAIIAMINNNHLQGLIYV